MKLPDRHLTQMALLVQGISLLGMVFWSAIARRVDKKTVYCLGIPMTMAAGVGLFSLQPGQTTFMYFLGAIAGFGIATAHLVPWSILPDVVDLDELNTGQRREGIFYSFMVMLQKLGIALSLFIVGQVLGYAGLVSRTAADLPVSQPESVIFAIRLMMGPIPMFILSMGVILAYFYPITREVHAEIRLQLQRRHH
jgi:GPH family glycoside/pentoside/hexuronide:cation symporter